jgi:[protein-PII] uridylyltransferase
MPPGPPVSASPGRVRLPDGVGAAAREARTAAIDAWLATLVPPVPGLALVAVGGLGRRECAPRSDLDLVLIHSGLSHVDEIAAGIWYPVWDARFALDHSVRTVEEALAVARYDTKAALGLLDARLVAGDAAVATALHRDVLAQWRREAPKALVALRELTDKRWQSSGELAFLLEGDLKDARGGLRDVGVLRGVGYAGVADATRPAVRAAQSLLLDVRDAMHTSTGRRVDKLLAQDRAEVARLLDLAGPDEVARRVTDAGRTIAYAADDAWRAVDRWLAGRGRNSGGRVNATRRPLARDVVEQGGEVVLARTAVSPHPDPSLALRVAAAAARAELPIARATLEWLAAFCPPPPTPWPADARDALLTLLGSGPGLVPTWEACDRYGLVTTWLPEWARVRSLPQHNPVHRFTVDRHLVETACRAAAYAREVTRPDMLVLAAFLHDIGKGLPGDHSVVGTPIARDIAARIGLSAKDVVAVARAVRLHLLLPDTATRRDLADPVTVATVAAQVRDAQTLALLHALAKADAAATGPAAWSTWKGRLVADLVSRVERAFDTGVVPPLPTVSTPPPAGPLPVVTVEAERVEVTAEDRRGLLAAVAGCLALHRLEVVTADTYTVDGVAVLSCAVQPRFGQPPDAAALAVDLRRAVTGELDVTARLARREQPSPSGRPAPRVVWQPATEAAVLELRAADSPGLLHRVAHALEDAGADVRAARISTLGGDVVDGFYLVGSWDDPVVRSAVESAVIAAVAPEP